MDNRLGLQSKLEEILGSSNVYFQPPEDIRLSYPCILYELSGIDVIRADDRMYTNMRRYSVTLIDPDPDSVFIDPILSLKYCVLDRPYIADDLNHYVFTLYY